MERFLRRRRRGVATPEVGSVDLRADRLEHRGQIRRRELIEMTTHQSQAKPEFVIAPQGRHGAADLRGVKVLQATELLKDVAQGQEGFPVAVGAMVQQMLPFFDLRLQLLHPASMFLELLAITPAMGRMLFLFLLEFVDQTGLREHFAGQVVLRCGHVVAPGHVRHGKGKASAGLIAVAQLPAALQLRGLNGIDLKAAQFRMETDHRLAGEQDPDVVVGQAEQKRELPRTVHLVHDHRRTHTTTQLG